jgi:hypothetical protein
MTDFNKPTRSHFFRSLVAEHDRKICAAGRGPMILAWAEARLMFKGATTAAIYHDQQAGLARSYGR